MWNHRALYVGALCVPQLMFSITLQAVYYLQAMAYEIYEMLSVPYIHEQVQISLPR